MAVSGVNYDEGSEVEGMGYKSVYLHHGNNKEKLFNSGNFVKDWWDMRKFQIQFIIDDDFIFCHSSSVDHFIMDGAPYDSAYMHVIDEKPVLKYVDRTDKNYLWTQRDIYEGGIEFFVPKGTQPTWEELKEICK
jgi:hypothetical protein